MAMDKQPTQMGEREWHSLQAMFKEKYPDLLGDRPDMPLPAHFRTGQQRQFPHNPAHALAEDPALPDEVLCTTCYDLGYVRGDYPVGHPDFGKLFPCPDPDCPTAAANRQRIWSKRLDRARIPERLHTITFERWRELTAEQKDGKNLALHVGYGYTQAEDLYIRLADFNTELDDTSKNCLMFYGPVGVGKSSLAVCMVRELLERGMTVLYVEMRDLIETVYERYNTNEPPTASDILREFQMAPVLVLDDMELYNVTGNRQDIVWQLIHTRYDRQLPTIMTGNLTPRQFGQMFGDRVMDRVLHMAHWLEMGGLNLRTL